MAYGDKRDYRKIEIFVNGKYIATTTWSKTCKEAKRRFLNDHPMGRGVSPSVVKAWFAS